MSGPPALSPPYWSRLVAGLRPYVPGEQPRGGLRVKLNTNEHPHPPSPAVAAAIAAALAEGGGDALRRYPDPASGDLVAALAAHHGLAPGQVFVGNGSDEVLALAFMALLKQQDADGRPRPLLMADVTYSFYASWCRLFEVTPAVQPLGPDFGFGIDQAIARRDAGALVLPNPNAPTGIALPAGEIQRLLQARPDLLVLIDEAYVDFGAQSCVPLIARFPNLLVVQTMSKSRALAGLRVGYALGQPALIEALQRVKDSFNSYPLDRLAQAGALASVRDEAGFRAGIAQVVAERQALVQALSALGVELLPSAANFVFARHPRCSGAALHGALRQRGVLVRHFASPPRIADFLRITVGTAAQHALLLDALRAILDPEPPT